MRKPTPREEQFRWHRAALHGHRQPTHESEPQVGFYLARLAYRAPYVPGSIWLEQIVDHETGELLSDEVMRAEIMGESVDVHDAWTMLAKRPICRLEYMRRLGSLI